MRLEQLEYLLEVARTGSINQASEKLLTAQQNVSRSLKQLENELGVILLNRNYQGIELTERGLEALAIAQEVVPKLHQLKALGQASSQIKPLSGSVTLLCAPAAIYALIPQLMEQFSLRYPNITLTVDDLEAGALYERLAQDHSVVGLSSIFFAQSLPTRMAQYMDQIDHEVIYSDRLAAFVSKKLPLSQQKSISLSSLLKHPLILYLTGELADNHIYKVLCDYGKPNLAFTTRNINIYTQQITQGKYVGFTSHYIFEHHQFYNKDTATILPIRNNVEFTTNIAVNKAFHPTPASDALINFIKEQLHQ